MRNPYQRPIYFTKVISMRKSIALFDDQYAFYKELKSEKLLVAFVEYMFEDIEPEWLNNMEQVIWNSLLERMDNWKWKSDAWSKSRWWWRPKKQQWELQTNNTETTKKQQKNNKQTTSISRSISNKIEDKVKVEDNKKNKFLDFVYLSEEEHQKLTTQLWKKLTDELIERLNNYIWSIWKDKYKSHYFTILSWSKKELPQTTNTQQEMLKERERKRRLEEAQEILNRSKNTNGDNIQTQTYDRRSNLISS